MGLLFIYMVLSPYKVTEMLSCEPTCSLLETVGYILYIYTQALY